MAIEELDRPDENLTRKCKECGKKYFGKTGYCLHDGTQIPHHYISVQEWGRLNA